MFMTMDAKGMAADLNSQLEGTIIFDVLSDFGKRLYMPNGITVQAAACKAQAIRCNATIGVALDDSKNAMGLNSIRSFFSPDLSANEVFAYSPGLGNPLLRQAWKEDMTSKNPSLKALTSLPAVTCGLTHSLFIAARLFISPGDCVIYPDLYWENYDLIFENQCGAQISHFNLFKDDGFDAQDFERAVCETPGEKVVVVLNFPNNPTGFTPSVEEADKIVSALERACLRKRIVVICDDAYFTLFFEKDCIKQSLFTRLADLSENLLAVKCDAATKEEEVWGFRIGFLTFASKGLQERHYKALESKVFAMIRGTVSCSSTPAQSILAKALTFKKDQVREERDRAIDVMRNRYRALKRQIGKHEDLFSVMRPLPFNSGYFMSFELCENRSDEFQRELLEKDAIGVISLFSKYVRVAFSSVPENDIPDLADRLFARAKDFFGK